MEGLEVDEPVVLEQAKCPILESLGEMTYAERWRWRLVLEAGGDEETAALSVRSMRNPTPYKIDQSP